MLVESSEQRTEVHSNVGGDNDRHGCAGPHHHEYACCDDYDSAGGVRRKLVNP